MNDIAALGQYGIVGVMLALIGLAAFAIIVMKSFIPALTELTKVIERLATLIDTKIK